MTYDEWKRLAHALRTYSKTGTMTADTSDILYSLSVIAEHMRDNAPDKPTEE